jgi:phospholipid-binding lipoprotein MlaA
VTRLCRALALACALTVAATAAVGHAENATPPSPDVAPGPLRRFDPLERWNRSVYRFNAGVDAYALLPAVRLYRFVVPKVLRVGFSNFLANLDQITSFTNSVLQLDAAKSAHTLGRFLVNSTLGCAGLADPASHLGLTDYREDFGQTLGRWGVGPGPYLVLPLAGPSSLRDGLGWGFDLALRSYLQSRIVNSSPLDPGYIAWTTGQLLDARDREPFRYGEAGPFEYDLVRYFYLEYRQAEVEY